ncbi:proton-coupled folate transporter-like [Glandiceps talaboti]
MGCTLLSFVRLRRLISVEPVIFCIMFVNASLRAIQVQYVQRTVGTLHNYTTTDYDENQTSGTCEVNKSDPHYILGQKVESESSYWILYYEITASVLTLFSATFLGSYSERGGGRKVTLLLPIVGYTLYVFCYLIVLYVKLPLQYLFIAEVVRGVTGNRYAAYAVCYSIIADITVDKQLTFKMIVLEVSLYLGGGAAELGTGYLINYYGFIPPTWIAYGVMILLVFYIIIWVQETAPIQQNSVPSVRQQFSDIFLLFSESSKDTRLQVVFVSLCLFVLYSTYGSATSIIMLYLLGPPFCASPVFIGYYNALFYAMNAIGMIGPGKLLSLCLGDLWMAQFGFLSDIASYLMIAMATSSVLFAVLGCVQGISYCLAPAIFNTIYAETVDIMPNLIFILYGGVLLIPTVLVGTIQCLQYRRKHSSFEPLLTDHIVNDNITHS